MSKGKIEYLVMAGPQNFAQVLEKAKSEGKYILGLEVTTDDQKILSWLDDNIDPQHKDKLTDTSAIDTVYKNIDSLTAKLAGKDVLMVTNRADLDSVGAMSLLTMALDGKIEEVKSAQVAQTVKEVNNYDNYFNGFKWVAKSVENSLKAFAELGGINQAITVFDPKRKDLSKPIQEKVKIMETWLKSKSLADVYTEAYNTTIKEVLESVENGTTTIELYKGQVAAVKSAHIKGLDLGYSKSPLVVANNPEFIPPVPGAAKQNKGTICQYSDKLANLKDIQDELNKIDPMVAEGNKWGGGKTIIGSPAKTGTGLSLEAIAEVIYKHADHNALQEALGQMQDNSQELGNSSGFEDHDSIKG